MSRAIGVLVASALMVSLAGCSSCAEKNPGGEDASVDAEDEAFCNPPAWASPAWKRQPSTFRTHVIDGQFGPGEWDGAIRLEGVLTDLYLDYQAPYLYALNDWRTNTDGIRPDCYNEFSIKLAQETELHRVTVMVFGDGSITIDGADLDGEGAYSRASSVHWDTPHTIYEFRLHVLDFSSVCVRLKDPHNYLTCEELMEEPVDYAIGTEASGIRVARVPDAGVAEIALGDPCGHGEGICGDGLTCIEEGGAATCVEQDTPGPDEDLDAVSDAPTDVTDEVPTDVPDAASDVDFPDEPSPDAADPDGYGEDGPS